MQYTALFFIFLVGLVGPAWAQSSTPITLDSIEIVKSEDNTSLPIPPSSSSQRQTLNPATRSDAPDALSLNFKQQNGWGLSYRGSALADRIGYFWNGVPLSLRNGQGTAPILLPFELMDSFLLHNARAAALINGGAAASIDFQNSPGRNSIVRAGLGSFDEKSLFIKSSVRQNWISIYGSRTGGKFPYEIERLNIKDQRHQNESALLRSTLGGRSQLGSLKIRYQSLLAKENGQIPPYASFPAQGFHRWGGLLNLGATHGSSHFKQDLQITGLRQDDHFSEGTVFETLSRNEKLATRYAASSKLSGKSQISAAAELQHDLLQSSYSQNQSWSDSQLDLTTSITHRLSPDWVFTPGLRWSNSEDRLISSLTLEQQEAQLSRWFSWSQGLRRPSLYDLYCDSAFCRPNENLRSEQSDTFELGFHRRPSAEYEHFFEGIQYRGAVFKTSYKDQISTVEIQPGVYQTQNLFRSQIFGFEGGFGYSYRVYQANINLTYLDAQDLKNENPLDLVPKLSTNTKFSYQIGPLIFSIRHRYWGKYLDTVSGEQVDLGNKNFFDFEMETYGLQDQSFALRIKNLLNESQELKAGFPEPQTQLALSYERQF